MATKRLQKVRVHGEDQRGLPILLSISGGFGGVVSARPPVPRGAMAQPMPGQSNGHRPFRLLLTNKDNGSIDWYFCGLGYRMYHVE